MKLCPASKKIEYAQKLASKNVNNSTENALFRIDLYN